MTIILSNHMCHSRLFATCANVALSAIFVFYIAIATWMTTCRSTSFFIFRKDLIIRTFYTYVCLILTLQAARMANLIRSTFKWICWFNWESFIALAFLDYFRICWIQWAWCKFANKRILLYWSIVRLAFTFLIFIISKRV